LVEAAISAGGLSSSVKITGFQKPGGVCCYLNAANVVVSGSLAEGWSVAMLEALACGKPLVSTSVSGIKEMILPRRNGFVVQGRDPVEFAKAMEDALALKDADQISSQSGKVGRTAWPALASLRSRLAATRF
jgi:glycosyltransferase involved in cell wall biosynthesis